MQFRNWFEAAVFDRAILQDTDILKALRLPKQKLQVIGRGSFATVYQHPTEKNKVIKVTKDKNDIRNLIKAQSLKSPNIVKLHPIAGNFSVGVGNLYLVVADKVEGRSFPYTSDIIATLIGGKSGMENAAKASVKIGQIGLSPFRDKVLNRLGLDDERERSKLSSLLLTVSHLEKRGIEFFDFTDNVIDTGDHHVIIDMGL